MKKSILSLALGLLLATFGAQAQLYTIDLSTLSSGEYTISNNYTELTGYPSQNIALKVPDGFKIYLKNCTIPETKRWELRRLTCRVTLHSKSKAQTC